MTFLPWWAAFLLIGVTHGHLRLNSIDAENSTMSPENTSATLTIPSKDKEKGFATYGSIHPDHHVTPVSIQIRNAFGGMKLSENVTLSENMTTSENTRADWNTANTTTNSTTNATMADLNTTTADLNIATADLNATTAGWNTARADLDTKTVDWNTATANWNITTAKLNKACLRSISRRLKQNNFAPFLTSQGRGPVDFSLCIPCVHEDKAALKANLLPSVVNQTFAPKEVIIQYSAHKGEDTATSSRHLTDLWQKLTQQGMDIPLHFIAVEDDNTRARAGLQRNRCAANAKFRYVSFMDADDIMHSRRLEVLASIIQKYSPKAVLHDYRRVKLSRKRKCSLKDIAYKLPETPNLTLGEELYDTEGGNKTGKLHKFDGLLHHSLHNAHVTVEKSVFTDIQQMTDHDLDELACSRCEDKFFNLDILKRYGRRNDSLILVGSPLSVYCK